jgi:hypothetical protein
MTKRGSKILAGLQIKHEFQGSIGSMEKLRMESRRKWFLAQLESRRMERLRMERLRMERLRKTFSSNWNQVEWKDIEWNHSERLLAQTGIR